MHKKDGSYGPRLKEGTANFVSGGMSSSKSGPRFHDVYYAHSVVIRSFLDICISLRYREKASLPLTYRRVGKLILTVTTAE